MLYMDLPVQLNTLKYKTDLIEFLYPQIVNLQDKVVMDKINKKIYNLMLQVCKELKNPELTTYIDGSYEIKLNERKLLSLSLLAMGDFHGAHPMTVIRAVTFDIDTGTSYELKDFFAPTSDYLKTINSITYSQLKEKDTALFEEPPKVKPNQDYFLTDKNIVIFFQLYEVAPYAQGFPYSTIAVYILEKYMTENSVLKRLLYM